MHKKLACYSGTCEIVRTGFRLEEWIVCSSCKQEVSQTLVDHLEKYKKKPEPIDNSDHYPDYNWADPTSD